jgi:dipeptidyl-peptidase-4
MRFPSFFVAVFLLASTAIIAQKKSISLEDIWKDGTFRMERLDRLHSMANGTEYAVQNYDRAAKVGSVDIYNYESGLKVRTAVNTSDIDGLDYFISYEFGPAEKQVLLSTKLKSIYRRSSLGEYYVFNTLSR